MVVSTVFVSIISAVIIILINALVIWLVAEKIIKRHGRGFKMAFVVALVAGVASFFLSLIPTFKPTLVGNMLLNIVFFVVNALVLIGLLKKAYDLHIREALLAWLIVTIAGFIIGFIVGAIIGFVVPG